MKCPHHLILAVVLALLMGHFASSIAHADILGFGDFSGFTVNKDDSGSVPTASGGTIQLTTVSGEYRSIFYDTPQNISNFTASFTFTGSGSNSLYGACFVLQNSASGASAVNAGTYGYAGFPGNSVGVTLELANTASGYYTDGNYGGGAPSASPVNLGSGDPINVILTYNGSSLNESLHDVKTGASYNNTFLGLTPFSTVLGGDTAYVGLTAGSSVFGGPSAHQSFSNLQFTTSPVPEPSTLALFGVGAIGLLAWVWQRARISC